MFFSFYLLDEEIPKTHDCDLTRMTKEKCGQFIMEHLHDFYTLINSCRVTHIFFDMMYKRHGIKRSEIPEFFIEPNLRRFLTSSQISAFEWTIINSCTNKMY